MSETRRAPGAWLMLSAAMAAAPAAASAPGGIEEMVVQSTRIAQQELLLPLAVSVVDERDIQLGRQQLGIDEALNRVPGLFFQNRYNFNQDLRISIRGFGAQAQFGIAGIHLTVDDIPITTPDGTAQVDDLDMASMGRIEVVRGPAGALYGTSAGGAINMYTETPAERPYTEVRAMAGAYDTRKYQLKTSGTRGRLGYVGSVHHLDAEGFRDYSAVESTAFNGKLVYDVDPTLSVTAVAGGVHSPKAEDPGALTPAELAAGPRDRARAANVQCRVDEQVDQLRGGIVVDKSFNESHGLRLRAYGQTRDFEARLPCPFVGHTAFDRAFLGAGAEYAFTGSWAGRPLRLVLGAEITDQEDDRQRWSANGQGVRGPLTEDILELVDTASVYALAELAVTDDLLLSLGGRYIDVDFELKDQFVGGTDLSDGLTFSEFTPMAGVLYALRDGVNVYASVSTSFETPTFAQLGDLTGPGINTDLEAQSSTNYEIGVKGSVDGRWRYGAAVFRIELDEQLVPFEVGGDVFYRNAGRTTREGIELNAEYRLSEAWSLIAAYTVNDFRFDDFTVGGTVLDGNDNPGIPRSHGFFEVAYTRPDGWYAFWDVLHVGRMYADDANSPAARVDAYRVSNLRGGRRFELAGMQANVFLGINNLFDEDYFGNVRINQSFNRFFEPAPDRHVYGGFSLRFSGLSR
ncbi:MAG: TonB-dependent receptor [Pseudomonadales bacterium]